MVRHGAEHQDTGICGYLQFKSTNFSPPTTDHSHRNYYIILSPDYIKYDQLYPEITLIRLHFLA